MEQRTAADQPELSHPRQSEIVVDSKTSLPVSSPGETQEEGAAGAVSLVTLDFFAGGLGLCQRLYDSLTLSAFQGHPGAQLLGVPFIWRSSSGLRTASLTLNSVFLSRALD